MVNILTFITFVALGLGQFSSISKSEGSNIYIFDILIGINAFLFFIYLLLIKKTFVIPKAFLYLIGFSLAGGLALYINSPNYTTAELITAFFYGVRFAIYLLFTLDIYNLVRVGLLTTQSLKHMLIAIGLIVVCIGFLQLAILPDFTVLDPSLGWDPHKNRLASTFFDPNFVGAFLVLLLTWVISSNLINKSPLKIAVISILLLAILLTFSRSTWLMTATAILIYGVVKNPKLLLVSILIMFLAYYSVPRVQTRLSGTTDPMDSAQFRFISWNNTLRIINDNPVFGVGYNAMRPVQKDYGFADYDSYLGHSFSGSDSSILFILATTGVVGAILFLLALVQPIFSKGILFDKKFQYSLLILPLLIESQFINSMFYPQILVLWLLGLAFSYL